MVESRHGTTNSPPTLSEHRRARTPVPDGQGAQRADLVADLMAAGARPSTATELSAVIGYRAFWIGQIAKRYNEQGPDGMHNRRHTTSYRPAPVLSAEQQEELRGELAQAAARNHHWRTRQVAAWMSEQLGVRSRMDSPGVTLSNCGTASPTAPVAARARRSGRTRGVQTFARS